MNLIKITLVCVLLSISANVKGAGHTVTDTYPNEITEAAFSPDGNKIITAFSDGTMKLCNLHGICLTTFKGHKKRIDSVIFNPIGNRILTTSFDGTAKLWNLEGKCLTTLRGDIGKKGIRCKIKFAIFNPAGNRILTAFNDDTIKLWNLRGWCLATLNDLNLATILKNFNPATLKKLLKKLKKHHLGLLSTVFNPAGNRILTSSFDGTIRLWNLEQLNTTFLQRLFGYTTITCLGILREKTPYTIYSWYPPDYLESTLYSDLLRAYTTAVFDPTGNLILTTSQDKTANLWDLYGKCLATLRGHADHKGHTDHVFLAIFNSPGNLILTASRDKTAKLWDLLGNCLATFQGHSAHITSAAFNPAGDHVVTASCDKTAKIWNLDGTCLVTLKGHTGSVFSATFNSKGNRILTTSGYGDRTAKLWDLNGNCLTTFSAPLPS